MRASMQTCLPLLRVQAAVPLQPGDAVLLNAANSTMGQLLVQLCAVLRLRCLALLRNHGKHAQNEAWLHSIGAHAVFVDADFSRVSSLAEDSLQLGQSVVLSVTGQLCTVKLGHVQHAICIVQ